MNYKYLVAAALQEELHEFIELTGVKSKIIGDDAGLEEVELMFYGKNARVALFTANKMGMPYTAAQLMEVITQINPRFTFFIGTCAGLNGQKLGSVVVPNRAFSYESGKYDKGAFLSDFQGYDFGNNLRTQAEAFYNGVKDGLNYKVTTDEDICSGAAVINDEEKAEEIKKNGSRKLSALDMEAYSVACINQIVKHPQELLVIKGISDLAFNKDQSENRHQKELAKKNSARFTYEFLQYLVSKDIPGGELGIIDWRTGVRYEPTAIFKLKIHFSIRNSSQNPVFLRSIAIAFSNGLRLDARATSTQFTKPMFLVRKDIVEGKPIDIYEDTVILKPGDSCVGCWVPLSPDLKDKFEQIQDQLYVGSWTWSYHELGDSMRVSKNIDPIYSKRIEIGTP